MTDKQIIIDGEQCEYLRDTGLCRLTYCFTEKSYDCSMCNDNPNCYYKQLKRKEQECEELRKKLIKCDNNIIVDCGYSKKDLCSFIHRKKEVINGLQEQLDQLKAENEELNIINTRLLGRLEVDEIDTSLVFNLDKELRQKEKEFYTAIQKVVKLKQTLTEIKDYCNKYPQNSIEFKQQILQKISECEGNNE